MNTSDFIVLLVDDDSEQVDLARRAAAECCPEINLIMVGGGDAVLNWVDECVKKKGHLPHIFVLDLKLPKLDGLAVLRKLRIHEATRNIPVVAYSAEYTQDDIRMSYQVGANTFVAKPTDVAQFSEFLRERLKYWKDRQ
jgi:CheY-like chemotaxis protein